MMIKINEGLQLPGKNEDEIFNLPEMQNITPNRMLELSIQHSFIPGITKSIEDGADVNYHIGLPLYYAIYLERTDIIELLLKYGANPYFRGNELVNSTLELKLFDILVLLINHGVDIDKESGYILKIAVKNNHYDLVKAVIDNADEPDVNDENSIALRTAVREGYYDIVKMLLNAGANVHAWDDYALYWSEAEGHSEVHELIKNWIKEHPVNEDSEIDNSYTIKSLY